MFHVELLTLLGIYILATRGIFCHTIFINTMQEIWQIVGPAILLAEGVAATILNEMLVPRDNVWFRRLTESRWKHSKLAFIISGAGATLLPTLAQSSHDPTLVHLGFGLGYICVIIFFLYWINSGWTSSVQASKYRTSLLPTVLCLAALCVLGLYHRDKIINLRPVVPIIPQPDAPTVEVKYSIAGLPFYVVPSSCIYLLELNRRLTEWPDEVCNAGKSNIKVPLDITKDDQLAGAQFNICEIKNHSEKDLVNIKMSFAISFRAKKSVPAIYTRGNGEEHLTFQMRPDHNGITWGIHSFKRKITEAFTEGDEILTQHRVVVIPSIAAHGMGFVYIVNSSYYPARFDLPTKITAIVSGNPTEQEVKLIRPQTGVFDIFPFWGLPPTQYQWKGLPDDK